MASDEVGLVPTQRLDNPMNPQLLFQDNNPQLRFRGVGEPGLKGGFMTDKLFSVDDRGRFFSPEHRRSSGMVFGESSGPDPRAVRDGRDWNGSDPSSGEDDEDDEDDDDDHDHDDDEDEGLVRGDSGGAGKNSHSSGDDSGAMGDKIAPGNSKIHASFGSSSRQLILKDGSLVLPLADVNRASSSDNGQVGRAHLQKMVTIAEHDGDMYYSQLLQGTETPSQVHKDIAGNNGCGFSGRKDGSVYSDPAETLRAIFSDPITGALMDDAMILPCGHSFGGGGIQQVIKMKACYTCSQQVSEEAVVPNLSLRIAVQAFRREEDMLMYRASKRRRERFEQEKGHYGDASFLDMSRMRNVQFPFAVTDRVIIKGNKRTPQRFVGREAIVTTQCLNGWYVVKTLDNAESVKLQYRSLEKVLDNPSASKLTSDKMTPNWL